METRKKLNLFGTIAVMAVIAFYSLSYVPPSTTLKSTTGFSAPKLHIMAYLALAASLKLYLHGKERSTLKAITGAAIFGIGMEIFQFFLPYRSFSLYDMAANSAGAILITIDFRSELSSRIVSIQDLLLEEAGSTFNVLDRS